MSGGEVVNRACMLCVRVSKLLVAREREGGGPVTGNLEEEKRTGFAIV